MPVITFVSVRDLGYVADACHADFVPAKKTPLTRDQRELVRQAKQIVAVDWVWRESASVLADRGLTIDDLGESADHPAASPSTAKASSNRVGTAAAVGIGVAVGAAGVAAVEVYGLLSDDQWGPIKLKRLFELAALGYGLGGGAKDLMNGIRLAKDIRAVVAESERQANSYLDEAIKPGMSLDGIRELNDSEVGWIEYHARQDLLAWGTDFAVFIHRNPNVLDGMADIEDMSTPRAAFTLTLDAVGREMDLGLG